MDVGILALQNPWWRGREYLKEDEDYRRWMESRVRWIPRILNEINLKPFSLHFIFGPRQVGKTTLLKLLVGKLLEAGVRGEGIFYFRCDQLADYKELSEVLEAYLSFRRGYGIEGSYILLDEVTFPREWYRAVKFLIDVGSFRNDVLVLTGSLSMTVKGEVETFPGRRGGGCNFTILCEKAHALQGWDESPKKFKYRPSNKSEPLKCGLDVQGPE